MDARTPIAIAAATYNRPAGLMRLLDGLAALTFCDAPPPIEVVIVDNSVDGNAEAAVEARRAGFPFGLSYVHERERGIAQARNRALAEATARGAEWLAFIDDDEVPAPDWLERMMAMAERADAEVVVGAVRPEFEATPPRWLDEGGFLAIERYGEGEALPFGNTSNVYFDLRFANAHGIRFNAAFALTGGEDTLFFDELLRRGARIVFCRSAVVTETIVPQRARLAWMVKRWVRSGNTDGRIVMLKSPGLRGRLLTVLGGGLARLGVGGVRAVATSPLAFAGRGHVPAEHLRVASRGWGFIRSAFGSVIEEYRTHER